MARFRQRYKLLILSALAGSIILFGAAGGRTAGKIGARLDQARGHLKIIPIGAQISDLRQKYSTCLLDRYNIHLGNGAGCIIGSWEVEYAEGYNSVSTAVITEKYGFNVLNQCYKEAVKQHLAGKNISEEEKQLWMIGFETDADKK
jgi:hypothetical protein